MIIAGKHRQKPGKQGVQRLQAGPESPMARKRPRKFIWHQTGRRRRVAQLHLAPTEPKKTLAAQGVEPENSQNRRAANSETPSEFGKRRQKAKKSNRISTLEANYTRLNCGELRTGMPDH
ncbi:MAG: hypothetical protein EOQ42_35590 [Mesorhizobium sp.]|nr:MAG: hypothetical protein EOQ42_35590 [Mesorhizobium sp.]